MTTIHQKYVVRHILPHFERSGALHLRVGWYSYGRKTQEWGQPQTTLNNSQRDNGDTSVRETRGRLNGLPIKNLQSLEKK